MLRPPHELALDGAIGHVISHTAQHRASRVAEILEESEALYGEPAFKPVLRTMAALLGR